MYETILYEVNDGICRVVMNRPEVLNSFNEQMNKEITEAFKKAGRDPEVRVIVLTGAGRAFSAGEDLGNVQGNEVDFAAVLHKRYNPMVRQIVETEKPVIAAINGVAAGAGANVALACDFRIMADNASMIQAFVNIGLVPDSGGTYFLPRLVGMAKAMELACLGEKISAEEALRIGLVNRVVPAGDFAAETEQFAARLAKGATRAIALIKRGLYHNLNVGLNEALDYEAQLQQIAGNTEDHKEGVRAFFEKRKPEFKGH